ncbi:MAG: 16S rRNA (cytosine(1402)-N(4))-methyltransferase RsmH [Chloroflexi bacterium]|nr:16S rRNA (cytosine(1402)-N(4))-methyltransferase RsmH [Chloroflexota bacterium]
MSQFSHKPVLRAEVLAALSPRSGGRYADGTVGAGGHAYAILEKSAPEGRLWGCDRDPAAVEAARQRLAVFGARFELRPGNFAELAEWVEPGSCDGVVLDLGVSSAQLEMAERGFSFQQDGPLDMRMNPNQLLTAAHLVNEADVNELARLFRELGGEPQARRMALAIERSRQLRRFETTRQLAELVESIAPRGGRKIHPATRVFQALRLAVNDELASLRAGLKACWTILKPGGRLAVISFHSLEDRIVKEFGRELERDYETPGGVDVPELRRHRPPKLRWVRRKAVQPSAEEIASNPRARSAQLRVMEKI